MPDSPEPRPGSQPDSSPGARVPEFDEFYLGSRRRLVLEAYALTGDLSAARTAVRDAFMAAEHHWDKVRRLSDAEEWVRPRAWAMAQRRHVARLWRREKGLSGEQKSVLDALHHLPDQQRKMLLLAHLAGLSEVGIGRELGESATHVESQVGVAAAAFCARTGVSPEDVTAAIESLAPVAEATALPHPTAVRRGGRRRRRVHAVVGVVTLLTLVLLGGTFVVRGSTAPPAAAKTAAQNQQDAPKPVTADMMLTLEQVRISAPPGPWQLLSTSDNTGGTGINSVCQDTRFADPEGRGTLVRTFVADGTRSQSGYVQTIEISRTPRDATQAYRTTLGWFAGCREARLQLLTTYRLRGLGETGQILKLRIPGKIPRSYVVGLTRTGSLTVSTVMETLNGRPIAIRDALALLKAAVRNVCDADASGACPGAVAATPVPPPRSGEPRGTLAAADLPVVGQVNRPWVGTRPVPARPNLAATTCDKAAFVRSGAPDATTRTFLIPQSKMPRRFGITETVGAFGSKKKAAAFVRKVTAAMASCEDRDLGAQISSELFQKKGYRGSEYALWRLESEIDETSRVGFWMGVARVGSYVAQVNFTPVGNNDIDEITFQTLVERARDRLFELEAR